VNARGDAEYRLRLAEGFLLEAEQDYGLDRWRSCVANSQLCLENAGKSGLMLFGASPKTHDPGRELAALLRDGDFKEELRRAGEGLVVRLLALGPAEHFLTDYRDETGRILPWDLFTRESAEKALSDAREALAGAREFFQAWQRSVAADFTDSH
jgi:HEPN domain-containing protein